MKKFLAILLTVLLSVSIFGSCTEVIYENPKSFYSFPELIEVSNQTSIYDFSTNELFDAENWKAYRKSGDNLLFQDKYVLDYGPNDFIINNENNITKNITIYRKTIATVTIENMGFLGVYDIKAEENTLVALPQIDIGKCIHITGYGGDENNDTPPGVLVRLRNKTMTFYATWAQYQSCDIKLDYNGGFVPGATPQTYQIWTPFYLNKNQPFVDLNPFTDVSYDWLPRIIKPNSTLMLAGFKDENGKIIIDYEGVPNGRKFKVLNIENLSNYYGGTLYAFYD